MDDLAKQHGLTRGGQGVVSLVGLVALCFLLISCAVETAVPSAGPTAPPTSTATAALPDTPTPALTPSPGLPPNTAAPTEPLPTESVSITHLVQPGDTLLGLALEYGVPMAAIQLQNSLGDSTVLHAGEVLSIPPQSDWEGASPFWIVHVVREGETLTGIARMYGLSLGALQRVNALPDDGRLQIGDQLVIPLEAPVAGLPASTPTPAPSPSPAPPLAPATAPPTLPISPVAPPTGIADWPREMAHLINEVRAQHGLGPLVYNEALALAAQAHADDCAQRGWCSHTGSDGSDIKARILRAGYEPTGWAECWAWSRGPQYALNIWMDETPPDDPHRRTLLSPWLTEIGVGVTEASWGYYFIADFGRP